MSNWVLARTPQAKNEIKCCGDKLDSVLWQGRQWAVTEYGLEKRDGTYAIERARLRDGELGSNYSWIDHMSCKSWIDIHDFALAFAIAREVHSA